MKKTWLLFRLLLKTRLRPQTSVSKRGLLTKLGIGFLLVISLLGMGQLYIAFFSGLIDASLEVLEMPSLAMDVAVLAAMAQSLLFGIFFVFGELFLSADGAFLQSLPMSGRQVFGAKFLYLYIIHLAWAALAFVPPVILYAVKIGGGLVYFLKALTVLLLLPLFPLLLSVVFSFVLMLLLRPIRRKEAVFTVASVLFFILIIAGQFWLSSQMTTSAADSGFLSGFVEKNWGAIRSFVQPPAAWASAAVAGGPAVSLISLILYAASAFLALWVTLTFAGFLYRKFAVSFQETAPARKQKRQTPESLRRKSPLWALFVKEWRVLLRSTVYATNALMTGPMVLVIMLLPMLQSKEGLPAMQDLVQSFAPGLAGLIMAGIVALAAAMNLGAFTAFSREGSSFWLLKTLPVPKKTLVFAKVLFGGSVNITHILPVFLVALFLFRMPVLDAFIGLFAGFFLSLVGTTAGMLLDAQRPKLAWVSEAEAIKQNMNGFLGMLLSFACVGLVSAGGAFLLFSLSWPPFLVFVLLLAVSLAISGLFTHVLVRTAESVWPSLDA